MNVAVWVDRAVGQIKSLFWKKKVQWLYLDFRLSHMNMSPKNISSLTPAEQCDMLRVFWCVWNRQTHSQVRNCSSTDFNGVA